MQDNIKNCNIVLCFFNIYYILLTEQMFAVIWGGATVMLSDIIKMLKKLKPEQLSYIKNLINELYFKDC